MTQKNKEIVDILIRLLPFMFKNIEMKHIMLL